MNMDISIPYYDDNTRVSRSSLNWFKISPKYFRDKLDGKIENESSSAMDNGTMRHAYLLQFSEFSKMYKILDFTIPSSSQQKQFCQSYIDSKAPSVVLKAIEAFKVNYSTTGKTDEKIEAEALKMALQLKGYIKWLRGNKSGQKTMSWAQLNSLKIMKENVQLHKKAKELLLTELDSPDVETHNEFHINWEYETKFGGTVLCKSLIDRLIIDHKNKVIKLIDIKTTLSNKDFADSFTKYDYGQQMAFYWMAIFCYFKFELNLDIEEYKSETYIVTIENGSNEVKVLSVPERTILSKLTEIDKSLSEIDWHLRNSLWDYTREYYEGDGVESLLYENQ
jgi:hypothetical protein